jgi:GTP-binding protein EngB required for normal cell division
MSNTNINILILGQTGSGKSSLINYLYGGETMKTGVGRPVTASGSFEQTTIPSPLKSDVSITIIDSWGLEANKAAAWEAEVNTKLIATLSLTNMIYGVIYCMSYSNDRIQDFEIAMLKKLLDTGYKTVIAFTNADNSGYAAKKDVFREKLRKELPEYQRQYDTVDICAKAVKKLGQASAGAVFGKEELFQQIERDVLSNFTRVLLRNWLDWRNKSIGLLDDYCQKQQAEIEHFYRFQPFGPTRLKQAQEKYALIDNDLRGLCNYDIFSKVEENMRNALALYSTMSGAFFSDDNIKSEEIGTMFVKIIPVVGQIYHFFIEEKDLQDKLGEALLESVNSIKDNINSVYKQAESIAEKLRAQNNRGN